MQYVNAESLKRELIKNGMYTAVDIVEDLQGYKTYMVTVRERIQGNYTKNPKREPEIYATFVIKGKSMNHARERAREKAKIRVPYDMKWLAIELKEKED